MNRISFILIFIGLCLSSLHSQEDVTELLNVEGDQISIRQYKDKFLVKTEKEYYWIDSLGKVYFNLENSKNRNLKKVDSHDLFTIREDNLVGVINSNGKQIIPVIYDGIRVVTPDVYRVSKYGAEAIINSKNELLHDYKTSYKIKSDGEYYYLNDSLLNLRDKTGAIVSLDLQPNKNEVRKESPQNSKGKNDNIEYADAFFEDVKETKLKKNGDYFVFNLNGKQGLKDKNSKTILQPKFDKIDLNKFKDGNTIVKNDNKYNVLSLGNGTVLSEKWYDQIIQMIDSYVCVVEEKRSKTLEIFSTKWESLNQLTLPSFKKLNDKYILGHIEGWFVVEVFDSHGNKIPIPHEKIRKVRTCGDDLVVINKDKKLGLYNSGGKEIIPCKYDYINCYSDFRTLKINDTLMIGNEKIIATNVDYYSAKPGDILLVTNKNKLIGLYDKYGNELLPQEYDKIKTIGRSGQYVIATKAKENFFFRIN